MDNNQLVIILFGLLYFSFIIYTRRKGNFEEFSVAGRNLGVFLIFASISASYIGPAMTLGLSRAGFSGGLFLCFIASITGVGLILMALFLAPKIRSKFINSYSIGDVLGGPESHNHKSVKITVGLICLWHLVSITIAMSYAGGELINNIFGFDKTLSIAIITSLVVIYSFFGGIRATIQTDAIQLIHFVVLIPILALLMIYNSEFSWSSYISHASVVTENSFEAQTPIAIFGLLIFWFFSGSGFDAAAISRVLASKDENVSKKAFLYSGIFTIFWIFIMVFIGSAGNFLHPELANDDQVLLHIAEFYFPGILYGIFLIAMIGVVMSTQDSVLNNSAIVFTQDIITGLMPNITDAQKLLYSRGFTIVIGGVAILVAGFLDSILNAIVVIFSFYMPVMIPVILFSVLKEKHYWQSAIAAMTIGFVTFLIWNNMEFVVVPSTLAGMIFGSLAYWVVDIYLEKQN